MEVHSVFCLVTIKHRIPAWRSILSKWDLGVTAVSQDGNLSHLWGVELALCVPVFFPSRKGWLSEKPLKPSKHDQMKILCLPFVMFSPFPFPISHEILLLKLFFLFLTCPCEVRGRKRLDKSSHTCLLHYFPAYMTFPLISMRSIILHVLWVGGRLGFIAAKSEKRRK